MEKLLEKIGKVKSERDLWKSRVDKLRSSILYYTRRYGKNHKKVKELKKELLAVLPKYEKSRKTLNRLYEEWRKMRGEVRKDGTSD